MFSLENMLKRTSLLLADQNENPLVAGIDLKAALRQSNDSIHLEGKITFTINYTYFSHFRDQISPL